MQFVARELIVRSIIMGTIVGLVLLGGIGLYASKMYGDSAAILATVKEYHKEHLEYIRNAKAESERLAGALQVSKEQLMANQAMMGDRFERVIAQMILLEVKQEKANSLIIDMRASCKK